MAILFVFAGCEESVFDSNDPRDDFTGTWSVNESYSKKSTHEVYNVEIEKSSSDSTKLYLINFFNTGALNDAVATVTGNVITLVSNQDIGGGFILVSGSGTLSSNKKTINWTYQVDEGSGIPYNVNAEYSRYE